MAVPPDRFARVDGRVNVARLAAKRVVIVGVGSVGSQIAEQLANTGVGHFRFVDEDLLDEANLARHALTRAYLDMNKAEGMTLYLADEIPRLQPEAIPRNVDDSMSDRQLDQLLRNADLIVTATGDHEVQRRVARRALALDIPAIVPGLYELQGGEVFVQRSSRMPCFFCWDSHRRTTRTLRGVAATNPDILAIIQLAAWLCFAILDPQSEYAHNLLIAEPGQPFPPQLFVQNNLELTRRVVPWRANCPSCAVGPATVSQSMAGQQPHATDAGPSSATAARREDLQALGLAFLALAGGGTLIGIAYLIIGPGGLEYQLDHGGTQNVLMLLIAFMCGVTGFVGFLIALGALLYIVLGGAFALWNWWIGE